MTTPLVLLTGALLASGLVALVVALLPPTPDLEQALGRISGIATDRQLLEVGPTTTFSERLGAYLYRHSPLPLNARQRQRLSLQGKSIAEFYSDKAVMSVVGAVLPGVAGVALTQLAGAPVSVPALAALVGAGVGFFAPDLLLGEAARTTQAGAVEALLVYIDLVTLERLANASATQALHNAATLSEAPVFGQIRVALERAQLEQQSPYAELRRLAEQLELPELTDIADVMQLDETGASLSGSLRARVRELRDAHLTREQIKASAAAEGMTLYMTLPALVFGLILMVPPLLRIVLG